MSPKQLILGAVMRYFLEENNTSLMIYVRLNKRQ